MNNAAILNQFDMVLALRRATINDALKQLVSDGTIKRELVLYRRLGDGGEYTYSVADTRSEVPEGAEFIDAQITPSIDIPRSGSTVVLVLNFEGGSASFIDRAGFGPLAKLKSYDTAGWKYGIAVNLDLSGWSAKGSHKSNERALVELNKLSASDFDIRCLFLDFASSDLMTADPATSACPKEMALFMGFYFKHIDSTKNPYILGYAATAGSRAKFAASIPPALTPSGTTYTMFADPDDPDASSLNYALVTKGGHGSVSGSPPPLDHSWFGGDDGVGQLIVSHNVLLERLVFEPLYNKLRSDIYQQVSGHLSVGEGNSYNAGRSRSGNTWRFAIAGDQSGDDRYVNTFTAVTSNSGGRTTISFQGGVQVYKEVSKGALFCTARAHAQASVSWAGNVSFSVGANGLDVSKSFKVTHQASGHSQNSCADAMSWIGRILGGILDVFTFWTDGGFFSNLLAQAFSVKIPGVGSLDVGLGTFSGQITSMIMLPSGESYKLAPSNNSPAFDDEGNLHVNLSR